MKIIYGTSNKHKIEDIKKIMGGHNFEAEVLSLKDIGFIDEIEENGKTFEENSEIKADAVYKFCKVNNIKYDYIITDDAGLCVDALNGEPGVYSARWLGEKAQQEDLLKYLIERMKEVKNIEDRTAKFVCVLTLVDKNGETKVFRGECFGYIAIEYGRLGGLTYSPIFVPKGFNLPMSELNVEEYIESHNHRAAAFNILLEDLKKGMK